jgi:gas vesicle protein
MSNQKSGSLFFIGLGLGSLIGMSLALLLAPQSGVETRSQLKNKSIELKDGAVEGLTEASHRAQEQVATLQQTLETGKHNATEAISHSIDTVTQAVTNQPG